MDNTNGRWQYAIDVYDSNPLWFDFGAPSAAAAVLLEATSATRIRFVPDPNFNTSILPTPAFTFRAWDMTAGAQGGTLDVSQAGVASSSYRTASATAFINGLGGLDYAAGPATATDEIATQVLTYQVTSVPSFIEVYLADGTTLVPPGAVLADLAALQGLKYKTLPDVFGAGTLTWTVTDDGLGASPHANRLTENLSITVNSVNDAPVRTAGSPAPINVDEDSANTTAIAVGLADLDYAPGPVTATDEASQTLAYQVTGIPSFITVFLADGTTPVPAGTTLANLDALRGLKYKTVPNANGSGTLTWTVTDNGPSGAPHVNQLTENLAVIVNAVNDAPTFNLTTATSSNEDAGLQTVPGFASNMSVGPPNESGQSLVGFTLTQTGVTGGLTFSTAPAISVLTGALTYRAAANANGSATFNVVLTDSGSNVSPNVNTSAPQSFTITVVAVNDAPSFTKGPDQIVPKNSPTQTVTAWATAISQDQGLPTHPSEQGQILNFIVNASNPGLFAVLPAIDAAGNLTYTPAVGASGASQVTVQLHDDGGVLNGGSDTSAAQTFNISITDGTTTVLTVAPGSSVIGQSVTLSALVTSNNPTNLIPDGTVDFVDTTNSITLAANVPLNASGQASVVVNSLLIGAHTLTATYSGSSGFTGSSDSETHQVSAADTTVSLGASASSTVLTQNVTFTATVTVNAPGSAANVSPAGSVEFFDVTTSTLLANVPLSGGQAQFSTSSLALGDHTIRATFQSGNSNFNSSAPDTELHTVNPNPVVFIAVPSSVKSGTPFTVVVYYLKNGVPDANFNGPIALGVNSGTPGGGIDGPTVVNASGGIATFSGIRINRAGTYTLKASAAGLPEVISPTIDITANFLIASVFPRFLVVNRPITMILNALDVTGQPAPNFNGFFLIKVLKKPIGARVLNRFGIFNGGTAVLNNLRVTKAGTYRLQITINGLTLTKTLVIRGRRSSSA